MLEHQATWATRRRDRGATAHWSQSETSCPSWLNQSQSESTYLVLSCLPNATNARRRQREEGRGQTLASPWNGRCLKQGLQYNCFWERIHDPINLGSKTGRRSMMKMEDAQGRRPEGEPHRQGEHRGTDKVPSSSPGGAPSTAPIPGAGPLMACEAPLWGALCAKTDIMATQIQAFSAISDRGWR